MKPEKHTDQKKMGSLPSTLHTGTIVIYDSLRKCGSVKDSTGEYKFSGIIQGGSGDPCQFQVNPNDQTAYFIRITG